MSSAALEAFYRASDEVLDFKRSGFWTASPRAAALRMARATGRSQVVLLSSHFERYFRGVNEEAVSFINTTGIPPTLLPIELKVLHSKVPIDLLGGTNWEHRADKLEEFVSGDAWLWGGGVNGALSHSRLLIWMKSPKPADLIRYYRYWGIQDIFSSVTRTGLTRNRLWLGIQEFVDKRNNIAHGDFAAQATHSDVVRYLSSARRFCSRADPRLRKVLARLSGGVAPW
jgi:RiboL-PSP-HEPN